MLSRDVFAEEGGSLSRPPLGCKTTRFPTTQTPKLSFRPWAEEDVARYVALLDDPEIWRYLPEDYPAPLTEELALDLIAISSFGMYHEVRAVLWNGQPVGQMRLAWDRQGDPEAAPSQAEIGYWLGRAHWGQGIGRVMVGYAVEDAFARHKGLQSLWARVHPQNPASARVLTAAGFVPEAAAARSDDWIILTRAREA